MVRWFLLIVLQKKTINKILLSLHSSTGSQRISNNLPNMLTYLLQLTNNFNFDKSMQLTILFMQNKYLRSSNRKNTRQNALNFFCMFRIRDLSSLIHQLCVYHNYKLIKSLSAKIQWILITKTNHQIMILNYI